MLQELLIGVAVATTILIAAFIVYKVAHYIEEHSKNIVAEDVYNFVFAFVAIVVITMGLRWVYRLSLEKQQTKQITALQSDK